MYSLKGFDKCLHFCNIITIQIKDFSLMQSIPTIQPQPQTYWSAFLDNRLALPFLEPQ